MIRPFLLYDDLVELCDAVIAMGMGLISKLHPVRPKYYL